MAQARTRKPWIRWALAALALILLYQILAGRSGLLKLRQLRAQRREIQTQIDSLQIRRQQLLEEKRLLLTDSAYLEKRARQELGMARPGEKVYRYVAPAGPPDSPER